MPIENRELTAGTRLLARHKKQDRVCEVVQTDDGLRYRLDDGTEHKSPSAAGKAAMDGMACNGWRFWNVEGTEPKPVLKVTKPGKTKKESAPIAKKIKSARNSTATPSASDASYGCGVCPETFETMTDATEHAMTHATA